MEKVGTMMGQYANVGMGFVATPILAAAPAAGPAAPFVAAAAIIASVVPAFIKLLNFGYNPRKLNDTAITEAVKQALNVFWYNLTGEALNGVNRTAEPGRYGAERIALFTPSAYPNVPYPAGPAEVSQIRQVIAEAQQIIAQGRSNLIRRESFAGYDLNANYMLGLMEQVAAARTQQSPLGPLTTALGVPSSWGAFLPWLLGGFAVYKWVL